MLRLTHLLSPVASLYGQSQERATLVLVREHGDAAERSVEGGYQRQAASQRFQHRLELV